MRALLLRLFALAEAPARWRRRRFTPFGSAVLGALVIVAALALDARHTRAFIPAALLAAAFPAAAPFALWTRARARRLRVERALPPRATAGVPFRYRVTLTNPGRHTAAGLWAVEAPAAPRVDAAAFRAAREPGEERRNAFDRLVGWHRWQWLRRRGRGVAPDPGAVPPLPPGGSTTLTLTATPRHRGWVTLDRLRLWRPDPLGLLAVLGSNFIEPGFPLVQLKIFSDPRGIHPIQGFHIPDVSIYYFRNSISH